jgi:tellurite resistance protein
MLHDLSAPEAALALSMMVGFTDDVMLEEEAEAVRAYYRIETAESLEKKLESAGIGFPRQLKEIEVPVLEILKEESEDFRLRTIAVAQIIAQADGTTSHEELSLIAHFAGELGVSLSDADRFSRLRLVEIDERGDYYHYLDPEEEVEIDIDLSPGECSLLVSTIIGFSDGELSEAEEAVVRDHFTESTVSYLTEKLKSAGLSYPGDVDKFSGLVPDLLSGFSRPSQMRALAVAWKTASADGLCEEESLLLNAWCEELGIGIKEVEAFAGTMGATV